ncbi:MAG TPA: hypothetical protein VMX97_12540 [Hyphomicrobiaceae bacterium]|nr:hypothetical protein [Hyphomicrobiaceae bacterium]
MNWFFASRSSSRAARTISLASRAVSVAALMIFFVSATSANASITESSFEETLTTALETLLSGETKTAVLGDTEVIVKPLRTWKSISGHYCRRYQVTVTEPASATVRSESTRCRESGVWKRVNEG